MKLHFHNISNIFKTAYKEWMEKDPLRESAVIAYYSIFSLPGLLVVITTLAGYLFGRDTVSDHVTAQITATLGADTAEQIKSMITTAGELKNNTLATVIGVVTIIIGATGVFAQFQKSLNIIWEVKADPSKSGIWNLIRVRLFSFGLLVSVAFMLIVSLVISATLAAFGNWLSGHFSNSFFMTLEIFNFILSLSILSVLFAFMFKYIPDAKIKWRHVWIGSLVTAFLFEIMKFGLGLYFGQVNPGLGYGAAGSVILIMIWASYSSMIVFYGAQFTRAYAKQYSGRVLPSEIAKSTPR
ncbi:MAG: YihY/virulence factor BrkB family protein [Elusimicrobia bacterium]|nr:YihY/virulence factor BrkB family protein [Candidatus Liberimonas magnetica]